VEGIPSWLRLCWARLMSFRAVHKRKAPTHAFADSSDEDDDSLGQPAPLRKRAPAYKSRRIRHAVSRRPVRKTEQETLRTSDYNPANHSLLHSLLGWSVLPSTSMDGCFTYPSKLLNNLSATSFKSAVLTLLACWLSLLRSCNEKSTNSSLSTHERVSLYQHA
jgi:hypothetical protein